MLNVGARPTRHDLPNLEALADLLAAACEIVQLKARTVRNAPSLR
jgi:hypothetical protein